MLYMGNFNRDNRSSGQRDFRRRDFGQRGGDRQMHRAVCSNCGKECEVPFRPSGDKPVYCNTCFERNNRGTDSRIFGDRNSRRSNFEDRESKQPQNNEQFNTLNAKLDKILAMLTSDSSVKTAKTPAVEVTQTVKTPEEEKMISDLPLKKLHNRKKE